MIDFSMTGALDVLRKLSPWGFLMVFILSEFPRSPKLLDEEGYYLFIGFRVLGFLCGLGIWYFIQIFLESRLGKIAKIAVWISAFVLAAILLNSYSSALYEAESHYDLVKVLFTVLCVVIGFLAT